MKHAPIHILDHGFVRLIETWGRGDADIQEAGIIEAARQSTQGSFRGWETDEKLLRYLFTNRPPHASPFEFAGMVIEVKAPIFVFREWHRHRTQSYNEMSARYAPLPNENYLPTAERILLGAEATTNKQAGTMAGAPAITTFNAGMFRASLSEAYMGAEDLYQNALACGVPKELARCVLPVGRYSQMRATTNLRNWLAFLTLRMDPGAQWEIRQYANAVGTIIAEHFPRTWELFAPSVDSVDGRDRVPTRYAGRREKIDEVRDSMTDAEFVAFCRGTAMCYQRNKGQDIADAKKRAWYEQMARHVAVGDVPDPRSGRPDFVPYSRPPRDA